MRSSCSLTQGKRVLLVPFGLIVPDSGCSLSIGWFSCSYNLAQETLIGYRHPGSDDFSRPTTASAATLPNPEEHVNFDKVIKAGGWSGKPRGGSQSHPLCKLLAKVIEQQRKNREQLPEPSCCYSARKVVFVKEKTIRERERERCSHPWATVTSQPWRFGVSTVEELHVVVAAVRLLFYLKGLEDELHAVAFLRRDHPLTVGGSRVVIVPKLSVWEQVLGFDFSLQAAAALCAEKLSQSWIFSMGRGQFR